MTFTVRQLDVFRTLMQTRNVTETARLLGISQPAASQILKELEGHFDLPLFVRRGGRISPTAEAQSLVRDVERLFRQMAAIRSHASELRDAHTGSLSIAAIPTVVGSVLPRAVAAFHLERPKVRIAMNAYDKQEIIRHVREERADLGILYAPVDDLDVADEPILRTAMLCLLPPGHALERASSIGLPQLAAETVIMHPSTPASLRLHERLQQDRPAFGATLETNQSFGAVALVRQGVGVFVTEPTVLMSGVADGLLVRPFEPEATLVLTAVYSRHRPVPRALVRFMSIMRACLHDGCAELRRRRVVIRML